MGINTGRLVAGVVGKRKFAYDIWGDTVNLASRMESNGEVGKVNVSEATYQKIKSRFQCLPRGNVEVKGKGAVAMYFVEGPLA
ncbi:MAG: adenylate/guanylate cyclase domain-containing protein [Microscillaceae bacterium]|nr:adenylate/guanylate cyclase domain-containing protein [Microscillaceae bacterium]